MGHHVMNAYAFITVVPVTHSNIDASLVIVVTVVVIPQAADPAKF